MAQACSDVVEGGSDALMEEVGRRFPFHFFPPLVDQDCPPRYLAVSGLHKKKCVLSLSGGRAEDERLEQEEERRKGEGEDFAGFFL